MQTLVDKKVRNSFELDPRKFRLSDRWRSAIARASQSVARELGLPIELLEARPYKLLVYDAQLNEFLSDATSEVGRIAAREDARRHLIRVQRIEQAIRPSRIRASLSAWANLRRNIATSSACEEWKGCQTQSEARCAYPE
jgi:hypothetical protein